MYFVYVLRSDKNGRFYVGLTNNIVRRVKEHNSGKSKSTKGFVPWVFFFSETFATRQEARNREKYLKSGYGKQWIKSKWSCSSAG